jgi:hypothetical protein
MGQPLPLRPDYDAPALRALARRSKDAAQARRLLALAAIYERFGLLGVESEAAQLDELTAAGLERDEGGAVGRDAERWAAGVARDIGEIVRQPAAHVVERTAEVGLPLEDGTGEQRVDAPAHARAR